MSWIKDNKFLMALASVTVIAGGLLLMAGLSASSGYTQAKQDFDNAAEEASSFERIALYPHADNRDGKSKALEEYRKAVAAIQETFAPFRAEKIENVSSQVFTNRLKEVNDEVLKAFKQSGTKMPAGFFSGFENYKTSQAPGGATGILGYQLDGVRNILLAVAASGASEIKNLHRPLLDEEQPGGGSYEALPGDVARALPLEITVSGSEKSMRKFISSITKPDKQFLVIRSLRISNTKPIAPKTADAKFPATNQAKPETAPRLSEIFDGAAATQPAAKPDAPKPAEEPPPVNTSRILAQVLGNEEIVVFIRLDQLLFLPAQPLP